MPSGFSNSVNIIGEVTWIKEPVYTDKGVMKFNFSINTDPFAENGNFVNVICWGDLAEYLADRIEKGEYVYVHGALVCTRYEKEGQRQYYTFVSAKEVALLQPIDRAEKPARAPRPKTTETKSAPKVLRSRVNRRPAPEQPTELDDTLTDNEEQW